MRRSGRDNDLQLPSISHDLEAVLSLEIKIIGLVDQDLVYTGVFPTDDLETALSQVFDPIRIKYELDPYGHVVTIQ